MIAQSFGGREAEAKLDEVFDNDLPKLVITWGEPLPAGIDPAKTYDITIRKGECCMRFVGTITE